MGRKDKRFVIQEHARGKSVHWDFMLEMGDSLQTYRLEQAVQSVLNHAINATKIFDHPLKFLTYQGLVNKGRGTVHIVEAGTYQMVHKDDNRVELNLSGSSLKGKFLLTHIKDDLWQFTHP